MENKLLTFNRTVSVQGVSTKSKQDAVQNAFASLQKLIANDIQGIMIYMKPIDVEVESYNEIKNKERYLGIFFSRTMVTYSVKLKVTVEGSVIDL